MSKVLEQDALVATRPELPDRVRHFRRPQERPFRKSERGRVKLLFGGLTERHDALIEAAIGGLGYNTGRIPTPTKADYHTGREYGNAGMCNPAYFTVGALLNYLRRLQDQEGLDRDAILENYVFVTAGSCGPCRFGMYESEFRLALRNGGFDGFRVLLFQQTGGLDQGADDAGLEANTKFALMLLTAFLFGDILNDLACQIRPYEVVPGQTDQVFDGILGDCGRMLREWSAREFKAGLGARLMSRWALQTDPNMLQHLIEQLLKDGFRESLDEFRKRINRDILVDYTRPKPVVKVIGEAWAQITEGDGNYRMFAYLEQEGAEVIAETMCSWVNYLLYGEKWRLLDEGVDATPHLLDFAGRFRRAFKHRKQVLLLALGSKLLEREYARISTRLGGTVHPQADHATLRKLARPFFNYKISGGESHLEVGKTIYYSINGLAHMVLSLKPFGCMPSTQSDGTQAAVVGRYPEILFLPIETSGEGDINAYSRVQMVLGDAKARCKQEFQKAVERSGYPLEVIRRFCRNQPELQRPLQQVPRERGVVGRAANFVSYVADLMDRSPEWSRWKHGREMPA
ncbi:MAG: activator of (R)-2-hydroxyglutaryl-CoA dehydratase [Candidatus Hydrogenedentes bacterium]|nr:activator of (R)-2-hydroxyglutaryl-CoA dehydratase [Candidatus Hydrogenedentota bacterium]